MKTTCRAMQVTRSGFLELVERPMIEVIPREQANDAYQKMKFGDVKFRMVLSVAGGSTHP